MNLEIINTGISGDTTGGMLARFNETVKKHNPSHVINTGGTNDLHLNLPDNLILSNILAMSRYAKYNEITPIIGVPTPFFNLGNFTDESIFITTSNFVDRIKSFQKTLKQFALDDNQLILDFTLDMKPDFFLSDGLHPNEAGHKQMMTNAIQSLKATSII